MQDHDQHKILSAVTLTHAPILHKQHIHRNLSAEVEHIDVVLDGNLQVSERVHLQDRATRVDRERGVGRHVGHKGRLHCQGRGWSETKAGERERD